MSAVPAIIRLNREFPEVAVLHADADLLVIDKPAGLLSAPDGQGLGLPYASPLLREAARRGGWAPPGLDVEQLVNAHRLDRDTSGALLFAWHRSALAGLLRQFRARTVAKTYLALVHGEFPDEEMRIEALIAPDRRRAGLSNIVAKRGARSLTVVKVRERLGAFTLVEATLQTGRHHQARVHLRFVGHPLVGDSDYGGRPLLLSELKRNYKPSGGGERPLLGRQALHAWRVGLAHPMTGQPLLLEAPLPRDLEAALRQLRRLAVRPRRGGMG
jgi:23S rRNA pseudouridine1911/1915/1917 synthase